MEFQIKNETLYKCIGSDEVMKIKKEKEIRGIITSDTGLKSDSRPGFDL